MYKSLFKLFLLTAAWISNSSVGECQILDTLYYNEIWQMVGRDSAKQYRIAEIDTINLWFTGKFQDYAADGRLLMEGQYSKSGLKNGPFKVYYGNGKIYCLGFFDNDELSGNWEYFTAKGKLKERIQFIGYDFMVLDSYDSAGNMAVRNGTGKWVKQFHTGGGETLTATGRYYKKKREGKWKLKDIQGKTVLEESYSNDFFIQGVIRSPSLSYYDESKFTSELFYPSSLRNIESFTVWQAKRSDYSYLTWLPAEKDTTVTNQNIEQPDQQAHYPFGLEAFYKKVSQVLYYPEQARARKIEGKVYVEFIVGKDGFLYDTHILRGIGGGCDQQAVIAILKAGRWFPAQKKGLPVEQRVVIPVTFRIAP